MRRRTGIAAVVAASLVATGVGVAVASGSWNETTISTPRGLFEFCKDKQLDIAGINPATLSTAGIAITNTLYDNVVGQPDNDQVLNKGFDAFVLGKSGIISSGATKQILVSQYVEYLDAAKTQPKQIRCKMRTGESLNRSDFQKLDDNTVTTTPWGFGPGTAAGPEATCAVINQQTVTNVDTLIGAGSRVFSPADVVVDADVVAAIGPAWTTPFEALQVVTSDGKLHVRAKTLVAVSTLPGNLDRFGGAHYCTSVAPEYLRDVVTGAASAPVVP
jgi:hypothetical protein